MSDSGRELFPYILTVLDAVDRLRTPRTNSTAASGWSGSAR